MIALMRAYTLLLGCLGALATMAQGFNKRYDAFSWGFIQGGLGIEYNGTGFTAISVSEDCDSTGPNSCFFHASVHLAFLDLEGNLVSEKRAWRPLHSSFAGWANCCDTVPGGGFVSGGGSEDTTGYDEVHLIRFNAAGDTLWSRVFGDPGGNRFWIGYQVKTTQDGGFLITGMTDQGGPRRPFALRTDANGTELWRTIYTWPETSSGGFTSCALHPSGDLFMGGTRNFSDSNSDHWLQRTDPQGNLIWRTSWGGPTDEGGGYISALDDGNILLASGRGYEANGEALRLYIAKLDATDGSIVWEHQYGPIAYSTTFFTGKQVPSGDLIACGVSYFGPGEHQRGILLRTNGEGDSLWMRSYYYQDSLVSTGQGRFYDVLPTDDGGFIAAGATYFPAVEPNPPGYSQDTWVVKVDGDGCIVPGCDGVGVSEVATNLLGALSVFPNPAQGSTTIRLALPGNVANGSLRLSLVAADGKVVRQESIAGNGEHRLGLEGLGAGTYYVHISTGGSWLTGATLLVE